MSPAAQIRITLWKGAAPSSPLGVFQFTLEGCWSMQTKLLSGKTKPGELQEPASCIPMLMGLLDSCYWVFHHSATYIYLLETGVLVFLETAWPQDAPWAAEGIWNLCALEEDEDKAPCGSQLLLMPCSSQDPAQLCLCHCVFHAAF